MKDNNHKKHSKLKTHLSNEYEKFSYDDRIKKIQKKVNLCITGEVKIDKKLGIGGTGIVYKVNTNISGESVDLAQKILFSGKDDEQVEDDVEELFNNFKIFEYITENLNSIANDPFLCECIEKVPLLVLTEDQKTILSQSESLDEQYKDAKKAAELKNGIFFEIKGNQNLEDLIPSKIYEMSFESKMKILLDILMGATILDKVGIVQRDFNCENIQICITKEMPNAYLVDFGKAVYKGRVCFYDNESKKSDYCAPFFYSSPPEAYAKENDRKGEKETEKIFGDKYNSFNIGLLMFPLFFAKEGQDLMYNFKWKNDDDIVNHRIYLFEKVDEIVEKLNQNLEKKYKTKQINIIKSILKKLINSDYEKRSNSEKVAREIYNSL